MTVTKDLPAPVFRGRRMREFARANRAIMWRTRIAPHIELHVIRDPQSDLFYWSVCGVPSISGCLSAASPQEAADDADRALHELSRKIARKA